MVDIPPPIPSVVTQHCVNGQSGRLRVPVEFENPTSAEKHLTLSDRSGLSVAQEEEFLMEIKQRGITHPQPAQNLLKQLYSPPQIPSDPHAPKIKVESSYEGKFGHLIFFNEKNPQQKAEIFVRFPPHMPEKDIAAFLDETQRGLQAVAETYPFLFLNHLEIAPIVKDNPTNVGKNPINVGILDVFPHPDSYKPVEPTGALKEALLSIKRQAIYAEIASFMQDALAKNLFPEDLKISAQNIVKNIQEGNTSEILLEEGNTSKIINDLKMIRDSLSQKRNFDSASIQIIDFIENLNDDSIPSDMFGHKAIHVIYKITENHSDSDDLIEQFLRIRKKNSVLYPLSDSARNSKGSARPEFGYAVVGSEHIGIVAGNSIVSVPPSLVSVHELIHLLEFRRKIGDLSQIQQQKMEQRTVKIADAAHVALGVPKRVTYKNSVTPSIHSGKLWPLLTDKTIARWEAAIPVTPDFHTPTSKLMDVYLLFADHPDQQELIAHQLWLRHDEIAENPPALASHRKAIREIFERNSCLPLGGQIGSTPFTLRAATKDSWLGMLQQQQQER